MNFDGLTFDDVLLRPQKGVLASRKDADISSPGLALDIPLIAAPMPSVATTRLLTEITRLGGCGVVHRMNRTARQVIDDYESCHVFPPVAIGLDVGVFEQLIEYGVRNFVLDVAHAHSKRALVFIQYVKSFSGVRLVAGNIATAEAAYDLIDHGADVLKVGIGPGSVCTTRQVTGFGVPQLEAIHEVRRAANEFIWWDGNGPKTIPVIADGGIRNSGDIVKALAAGADAVMIGKLFANSVEAGTSVHFGNAAFRVNGHRAPEGTEISFTDQSEPLEDIIKRLTWGIRSGISYAGATNIRELQENAEWIKLTDAGRKESKLA